LQASQKLPVLVSSRLEVSVLPMEKEQYQQAMPAVPPSYDVAMSGHIYPPLTSAYAGAGNPPGQGSPPTGQMYSPSQKKGGPPDYDEPDPLPAKQTQLRVVTHVQYLSEPSYGNRPVTMVCPHCQKNITTRTHSQPSALAWIIGAVLCLTCMWPCACIPCCVDTLQQVTHTCPACNMTLGMYKGGFC